jgi:hypothetical protein
MSHLMEKQAAGHHSTVKDGRRIPRLWGGGVGWLFIDQGAAGACLVVCGFLFLGPVAIGCDDDAALSLCKDRKEGQRAKHIDIIHHLQGIMWQVGS